MVLGIIEESIMRIFQHLHGTNADSNPSIFERSDDSIVRLAKLIVSESERADDYPQAFRIVRDSSGKDGSLDAWEGF